MDLLGTFLGWNWKVQRTRRKWDRLREHALEKKGMVREKALKQLDDIEDKLIKEHLGQVKINGMDAGKEERLVKDLMGFLSDEKQEGETIGSFENRIKGEVNNILHLEDD